MAPNPKANLNQEFHMNIVGKNVEVTNALRDYVLEKMHRCEYLVKDIIHVHVRLEVNKVQKECMIRMKFSHFDINVHAITDEMYTSIDKAFDRLYDKIRKWKTHIQNHHAKGISATEMQIQIFEHKGDGLKARDEATIDANNDTLRREFQMPKVTKMKSRPLKMLTMKEALIKLELSGDYFLVFRSEEDQAVKVMYRRRDGSYGVILPEA